MITVSKALFMRITLNFTYAVHTTQTSELFRPKSQSTKYDGIYTGLKLGLSYLWTHNIYTLTTNLLI